MKPVIRYQSQLLYRRSYQPNRILRIKPTAKLRFSFRPVRFGVKPAGPDIVLPAAAAPRLVT